MQVAFRCKRSGNLVRFQNPDDIAGLRKHEGYEEVIQDVTLKENEWPAPSEEVRKRGRPAGKKK